MSFLSSAPGFVACSRLTMRNYPMRSFLGPLVACPAIARFGLEPFVPRADLWKSTAIGEKPRYEVKAN